MIAERRVRVRTACAHSPQGLPREKARARSFLPRGVSRQAGGAAAMRVLKGDGFCRGAPRGRRIPPDFRHPCRLSWHPDGRAATRLPKGDASCRETAQGRRPAPVLFSLAGFRGVPRRAASRTQKACPERQASNTKLCSRARAYRLSASTGQEEMQAPHSMHSSSLTSA